MSDETTEVNAMDKPKPYVTATRGMRGWFAVLMWWNPEGFWEPWSSGIGSYDTAAEADREAKEWAEAEEIDFKSGAPCQLVSSR